MATERIPILRSLDKLVGRVADWAEANPEAIARLWLLLHRLDAPEGEEKGSFPQAFIDVFLPPNWMTLRIGAQRRALELSAESGICLIWVPRSEIVEEIVLASDRHGREAVLLERRDQILEDVEAALSVSTHPEVSALHTTAIEALAAIRAGLVGPGQVCCAAILTSILEDHYGFDNHAEARRSFAGENLSTARFSAQRRVTVQQALIKAFLNSSRLSGEDVFNRHLSVHRISRTQLNEVNALSALMLAVAAICELQECYRLGEFGFSVTPGLKRPQKTTLHPTSTVVTSSGGQTIRASSRRGP
jgi:hypothetical protein